MQATIELKTARNLTSSKVNFHPGTTVLTPWGELIQSKLDALVLQLDALGRGEEVTSEEEARVSADPAVTDQNAARIVELEAALQKAQEEALTMRQQLETSQAETIRLQQRERAEQEEAELSGDAPSSSPKAGRKATPK